MIVTYGIIDEIYSQPGNSRISHGIAAYANIVEDGTTNIVAAVHDITDNLDTLAELVKKCNQLNLSPMHLNDVIDDFLAE